MLLAMLPLTALAGPDLPFVRLDEALYPRQYVRVVGDGPAWGRYRRKKGDVHAWLFPEGHIEHFHRFEGRERVETRRYTNIGKPLSTAHWSAGRPLDVTVRDTTWTTDDWVLTELGPWTLFTPDPPSEQDGSVTRWRTEDWELAVQLQDKTDVFAEDFASELARTCGCRLTHRDVAWIDGTPAAEYHAVLPDPLQTFQVLAWAVPSGSRTLLMSFVWAADAPPEVARLGTAVTSLAERRESP